MCIQFCVVLFNVLDLLSIELYAKIIDKNNDNTYECTYTKKVIEKFMQTGQVGWDGTWKHALKVNIKTDHKEC
jgi:hypothetical protein